MNEQDHDNTMVIAVPPDDESPDESGSESGNSCNLPVTSASEDTGAGTTTATESDSDPFDDTSDEDNEETNIAHRIDFLSEKRSLLKRAYHVMAQEDIYDAAIAIDTVRHPKVERLNSIWTEAKGVLKELNEAAALAALNNNTKTIGGQEGESRGCLRAKTNNPDPSDPKIDKSSVRRLMSNGSSSSEDIDVIKREGSNGRDQLSFISSIPSPVFGEGQWLAQALVYAAPTSNQVGQENTLDDCRWKVVSDPFTSSLGLVPPSSVSMHNAVDIQEATAFTEEPRLVTQSTPPFCVVHVNKAFLMMANLPAQDSLIGQPIESVIQVTQQDIDMSTNNNKTNSGDDDERYLESILSRGENKACRVQVVPVLDRSRRQRVTESSYTCMSHVLIRVRESTTSTIHTSTPITPIHTRPRSNSVPSRIPDLKNLHTAANHSNASPVSSLGAIG
jgi:hypothetical protein